MDRIYTQTLQTYSAQAIYQMNQGLEYLHLLDQQEYGFSIVSDYIRLRTTRDTDKNIEEAFRSAGFIIEKMGAGIAFHKRYNPRLKDPLATVSGYAYKIKRSNTLTFRFTGNYQSFIDTYLSSYMVDKNELLVDITEYYHTYGFNDNIEVSSKNVDIRSNDTKRAINDFYPWLSEYGYTLESFLNEYLDSEESILLLQGLPGTGKTTFLKELAIEAANRGLSVSSCNDTVLLKNRASNLLEVETDVLILEDSDVLVGETRKEGSTVISSILNKADGLGTKKTYKLVLSTNITDINKIDKALLRPGRCFGILDFRKLTQEEGIAVAKALNKPFDHIQSEITLAEIAHYYDKKVFMNRKSATIGFSK